MMEKKVSAKIEKVLNKSSEFDLNSFKFPAGTRFTMNGIDYLVVKDFTDGNVDFVEIDSKDGREVMELRVLRKDIRSSKDFAILE